MNSVIQLGVGEFVSKIVFRYTLDLDIFQIKGEALQLR